MHTTEHMGRYELLDRLAAQVGDREKAISILQARGHMYPNSTEYTPEGAARNAMTAEERALDREAKKTHNPFKRHIYNPLTNRVRRRR